MLSTILNGALMFFLKLQIYRNKERCYALICLLIIFELLLYIVCRNRIYTFYKKKLFCCLLKYINGIRRLSTYVSINTLPTDLDVLTTMFVVHKDD